MPLVWPVLSGPLSMNYGMIGAASTIFTAASSLTQPIFGYLGDRSHSRRWAALGLALAAIFIGLIGFVDSYPMLIGVVIMLGMGVAAFHPQGAMNAAIAGGPNKATAMSIFSMGGTSAYARGSAAGRLALHHLPGAQEHDPPGRPRSAGCPLAAPRHARRWTSRRRPPPAPEPTPPRRP